MRHRKNYINNNNDHNNYFKNFNFIKNNIHSMMKINKNASFLKVEQVPIEFRESFIHTGYRLPNSSFKACLKSLLSLNNNEIVNFWTHFLPFLYSFYELIKFCLYFNYNNQFYMPLFIYLTTICFYLLMSSLAHAFNCMSPIARHLCFILDYLSISLYGIGCAVAYKAYSLNNVNLYFNKQNLFDFYLWIAMAFCIIGNLMSCESRFIVSTFKKRLLRVTPFIGQYICVNSPVLYRLFLTYQPDKVETLNSIFSYISSTSTFKIQSNDSSRFSYDLNDSNSHLNNYVLLNYNGSLSYFRSFFNFFNFNFVCESDVYYFIHFAAALVSVCLYVFHIPERFFPGRFDIVGQSHQIFHLTTFLSTYTQLIALKTDIKNLILNDYNNIELRSNINQIILFNYEFTNKFIVLVCVLLNTIIFFYFYFKAVYNNPWKKHKHNCDKLNHHQNDTDLKINGYYGNKKKY